MKFSFIRVKRNLPETIRFRRYKIRNVILISLLTITVFLLFIILLTANISVNTSHAEQEQVQIKYQNYSGSFEANSSSLQDQGNNNVQLKSHNDNMHPLITITYPGYPSTVTTGQTQIKGTFDNSQINIHNITALARTYTFNGSYPLTISSYPLQIKQNRSTDWYVPIVIDKMGIYTVQITGIDNTGKANLAQTVIKAYPLESTSTEPRISFVRSTFTEAAYQENGFYDFYFKYQFPPFGTNITTDLDNLTVKIPKSGLESPGHNLSHLFKIPAFINRTELSNFSSIDFPEDQQFWIQFLGHVKEIIPHSTLTVMRDEDVHDGHIFYQDQNRTNAYDILILSHNEYVTQQEYDNFRQFVKNGGTIIFIDPNIFYAEVKYDRANHTMTLVNGHDWKFDGKAASRSLPERWYNDTKEWVGGNFLINDITDNVTFTNNPFNYTHYEEQFVNNPEDKIIIDYGVKFPENYTELHPGEGNLPVNKKIEDVRVATYVLQHEKGRVIMIGLFGQKLIQNQDQEFLKFFDDVILQKALCPKFESCHRSS